MLQDAEQSQTDVEVQPAGDTQSPETGSESQAMDEGAAGAGETQGQDSAQQGQGATQQNDYVPRHRLNEEIRKRRALEEQLARQAPQQQVQPPPPKGDDDPKPKLADFETYEAFVESMGAWSAREEHRKIEGKKKQQEAATKAQEFVRTAEENWSRSATEATTKYQDFEDVLTQAPALTNENLFVLKRAKNAGDVAYHLAKDHELIRRLNSMHPIDAAQEIGRLSAKLEGSSGQPRKPSAGIPAMKPVSAGTKTGALEYRDNMTPDEYIAWSYGKAE